jgi:hypothetical protein
MEVRMISSLRARMTFANVVSLTALFIALGGTAAAASYIVSANSQIGPGTVAGHLPPSGKHANVIAGSLAAGDLHNRAVTNAKIAPGAVTGSSVKDGSLRARDLQAGALGGGRPVFVADNSTLQVGDPDPCASGRTAVFCGAVDPGSGNRYAWENYGSGYTPAQFYKDGLGVVHLSGLVKGTREVPRPLYFILPPGYRPSTRHVFAMMCEYTSDAACRIDVSPNGDVEYVNGELGMYYTTFDGISFRAGS